MPSLNPAVEATIKNWRKTLPNTNWKRDTVLSHNSGIDLFYVYKDESDGHYCQTHPDGRLTIGTFEIGYPHVTEGIFTPLLELKLSIKEAKELQHKLLKRGKI